MTPDRFDLGETAVKTTALVVLTTVLLVSGCGAEAGDQAGDQGSATTAPTAGAAALGAEVTSIAEVAKLVQNLTGECANAKKQTLEYLTDGWGGDWADVWAPYVEDWALCQVGSRTVSMFRFKPGRFAAFQQAWKDAVAGDRISRILDDTAFGNGYAISSDEEHLAALGLKYLRCEPVEELNSRQIPSDAPGCVFAETAGM